MKKKHLTPLLFMTILSAVFLAGCPGLLDGNKWEVSFDPNQGTGSKSPVEVRDGEDYTVPVNDFVRPGHCASGWNTNADGCGTAYADGSVIKAVHTDIELYASWDVILHTVTFDPNQGTGSKSPVEVRDGEDYTVPVNDFVRPGHRASGWNTNADGSGTAYADGSVIKAIHNDIALYASWDVILRTVSFDRNGGTGDMVAATVADGNSYTVPACTFSRTGYEFLHWNTEVDDSGDSYAAGTSIANVSGDLTLHAIWKQVWTISFDANGGTGTMSPATIDSDASYSAPAMSGLSRTDYRFVTWNSSADGKGATYYPGDAVPVTSDFILYAIWLPSWLPANAVLFMDFEDGQSLGELFPTIEDAGNTVSIADTSAMGGTGRALRKNLAAVHRLERSLPFTMKDLWVMFDVYVESADTFFVNTHTPLILICDSDKVDGAGTLKLVGTPLYSGLVTAADEAWDYSQPTPRAYGNGFFGIKPLTNIESQNTTSQATRESIMTKIIIPAMIDDSPRYNGLLTLSTMQGRWINIRYHIRMDDSSTEAGLDLYVDGSLALQTIAVGDAPEDIGFDLLRLWYHESDSGNYGPNTNIYLDNIGVYSGDPLDP